MPSGFLQECAVPAKRAESKGRKDHGATEQQGNRNRVGRAQNERDDLHLLVSRWQGYPSHFSYRSYRSLSL